MDQMVEKLEVSDEVLAICAANAARRTDGVIRMEGGFSNALSRNLLGKELIAKGIRVIRSEYSLEINTHVVVKYGCHIPSVAWDIQKNVRDEIYEMTGNKVTAVNINIEGVETDDKN